MRKIGSYKIGNFPVATYLPKDGEYRCVRDDELPRNLTEAFHWEFSESDCPAGYCYLHELKCFMSSSKDPWARLHSGRIDAKDWVFRVLKYTKLNIPVWKCVDPARLKIYPGEFVRQEDMPEDFAKAFKQWQIGVACPGPGMSYVHDFVDFMDGCILECSGDYFAIVEKYLSDAE